MRRRDDGSERKTVAELETRPINPYPNGPAPVHRGHADGELLRIAARAAGRSLSKAQVKASRHTEAMRRGTGLSAKETFELRKVQRRDGKG